MFFRSKTVYLLKELLCSQWQCSLWLTGRWLPACSAHSWGRAIVGASTLLYRKWHVCSRKGFQSLGIFFPNFQVSTMHFFFSICSSVSIRNRRGKLACKVCNFELTIFYHLLYTTLLYSLHIN